MTQMAGYVCFCGDGLALPFATKLRHICLGLADFYDEDSCRSSVAVRLKRKEQREAEMVKLIAKWKWP